MPIIGKVRNNTQVLYSDFTINRLGNGAVSGTLQFRAGQGGVPDFASD